MKLTSLRCVDYLDWLKEQEEVVLCQIEVSREIGDIQGVVELGEELQIIRELKTIAGKYEDKDE